MDKQEFADFVYTRYQQDPNGRLGREGENFVDSDSFTIEVTKGKPNHYREGVYGTGFGSSEDYGRTWKAIHSDNPEEELSIDTDRYSTTIEELKEEARQRVKRSLRQINFVKKEGERRNREVTGVYTGVEVVLTENGYSILPHGGELVEPSQISDS